SVGGVVTSPSAAPAVAVESTSGGTIAAGTYYCVITYGNKNGETMPSPQGSVTTTGATSRIKVTPGDYHWLTGAYKMRVYCGTTSGGPYYLQTPWSYSRTIAAGAGSIARTSNVVTVTTTAAHGFAPQDTVTISGVDDASFDGTFTVKDVLTSTSFTYAQTAANASSQNGAVTFSTALDTDWHYVSNYGNVIFSAIAGSGTQPPDSNTATIDPMQAAVNATRTGTDTFQNAQKKKGKVLLGQSAYTLTTPLVLGFGDVIEGYAPSIDLTGATAASGSRIACAWADARAGCVMPMTRSVTLRNVTVTSSNVAPAILYVSAQDSNGMTLDGVQASVPSATGTAAIRAYNVIEAHGWEWNRLTVGGGQHGVLFTHSAIVGLRWYKGRINMSASGPAGNSAIVQGSGFPDVDRGAAGAFGAGVSAELDSVVTESVRGRVIDWKGGLLKLGRGFENADNMTDAGTDALIYLDWNASSDPFTVSGFIVEDTMLFGHANAGATVKFGPGAAWASAYALVGCRNATVFASAGASSISVDLGNVQKWDSQNCGFPNVLSTATSGKIINPLQTGRAYITATGFNQGGSAIRAPLFLGNPYVSGTALGKCLDFDSAGGGAQDDFVVRDESCATELTRVKATTGNYFVKGTLRWKSSGGGAPANYFELGGTPTGARVLTAPDASFTLAGINLAQTFTQPQTFNTTITTSSPLTSTVSTGTAPFAIASTTEVANLNTQQWHSKQAIDFSAALDFGSIAAQSCAELTITASGAAADNAVAPSWPAALEAGLTGIMYVSASNTITVRLCNVTAAAVDPASRTFAGRIIK
ncbi:MAG TPA: hypothetical protein VNL38_01610, partial [Candidatus Nitrosotenuis sp.]|nr:hypothetical protein [Candidatus Nitrosotenuis sp.]